MHGICCSTIFHVVQSKLEGPTVSSLELLEKYRDCYLPHADICESSHNVSNPGNRTALIVTLEHILASYFSLFLIAGSAGRLARFPVKSTISEVGSSWAFWWETAVPK